VVTQNFMRKLHSLLRTQQTIFDAMKNRSQQSSSSLDVTLLGMILKRRRSSKSRVRLPISRNEFEKLKAIGPTLEEEVLDFLSKNRQSAYTSIEIVQNLFATAVVKPINDPTVERVNVALESLLTRKAIVGKQRVTSTGSEYYFTIKATR